MNSHIHNHVFLQKPKIVGYMSVDVAREYHSDLSELKFVNNIPDEILSWDLNHNIDSAVKRTTQDNVEKIDLLLKFLLDQGHRFNLEQNDCIFITYRRTLISVMCTAFGGSEPLRIIASYYNNCIFLFVLESLSNIVRTNNQLRFCAWGYKFEQYLTSDLPNISPDIEKPVIENAEFSTYLCTSLGEHKLLYGAQIDGAMATRKRVPNPPNTNVVDTNLNYLRSMDYIELKTNRKFDNYKQEKNFKKHKMLRCWCQCYLANLKGLLVGFRNDHGIIERLQWYDTESIPEYCKREWNPQVALDYLNYFLSYVKESFNNRKDTCTKTPITLQFDIDVNCRIQVSENQDPHQEILPDWFLKAFNKS